MPKATPPQPRILHSASLLKPAIGVLNQMQWEQEAARHLGIPWKTVLYCPSNSISPHAITHYDTEISTEKNGSPFKKVSGWVRWRRNYYQWLKSQIDNYDIILLRYYYHDLFQWYFVKNFPKPVYFVHHTLEEPELALPKTLWSTLRSRAEAIIGRYAISHVQGLIAVTEEILEYEKSRAKNKPKDNFIYANGIYYPSENPIIDDERSEKTPEILFAASEFSPWHGLDLLIQAARNTDEDFILHLVGKVPTDIQYAISQNKRIVQHGVMNQADIAALSRRCWLGLSSFALYRKNMKQACTLKVREYLMMGLPVYANYQDVFPASFPYFKQGACNMQKILEYARAMRCEKKSQISLVSKKFIDKKVLLKTLYDKLVESFLKKAGF